MIRKIWTHLYKNLSNEQLVEIIKKQSSISGQAAFHALYNNLSFPLFNYLYYLTLQKEIAEELTNETFFTLYEQIDRFDTAKPLRPWLWRIGRNKAFNYLKKHKEVLLEDYYRDEDNSDPLQNIGDLSVDSQLESLISHESRTGVQNLITRLRPSQREALELWMEGNNFDLIAEVMQKSPQAVKNLIHRAKQELLSQIKKQKEES